VRNIYAGTSNQMGVFATQLRECGFTGERDGPATVFGTVMSDTFRETALVDGLGERYEISKGYFKSHSCCRYNHAALDALLLLRQRSAFDAAEVEGVEVETYGLAAALRDPHPSTTLAARFSIPYAIAVALIREGTSPSAFDETALTDVAIRSLAERVDVREVSDFTAMAPERRPARVTVHLTDGRTLTEVVYESRGDPGRPFDKEELVEKYLGLASPVIGEEKAGRTLRLMEHFPEQPGIGAFTELLRGEATSG
jgi:2-methylcitrate dehydratase PrpD